jgi:hypothetical protein
MRSAAPTQLPIVSVSGSSVDDAHDLYDSANAVHSTGALTVHTQFLHRRNSDAGTHIPTPAQASHSSLGASFSEGQVASMLAAENDTAAAAPLALIHRLSSQADLLVRHGSGATLRPDDAVVSYATGHATTDEGDLDGDEYASPPRDGSQAGAPPNASRVDVVRLAIDLKQMATDVSETISQLKLERRQRALATREIDALTCENTELTHVVESLLGDVEELKDIIECLQRDKQAIADAREAQAREIGDLTEGAEGAARIYEELKLALSRSMEEMHEMRESQVLSVGDRDTLQQRCAAAESSAARLAAFNTTLHETIEQQHNAIAALQHARLW